MTTLAQLIEELFDRTKWMRELQPLIDHLRTMHDGDPLPYLAAYVSGSDDYMQTRALQLMMHIDFDRSLDYALPLLKDEDWQYFLCDRFCRFQSAKTIDGLVYLLQTAPDPNTRYLAALGLGDFGDARALTALEHAIAYDDGEDVQRGSIREAALEAVEAITRRERERTHN